jgi:surfactin synthase thioesterase subunit
VDGQPVFYREAGDPAAPHVVLLHGAPASSHMFRELIPRLAGDYHVVAPDLIGFGLGGTPPGAEAFHRDLPDAEIRLLDGGHFLLESHLDEATPILAGFLGAQRPGDTWV